MRCSNMVDQSAFDCSLNHRESNIVNSSALTTRLATLASFLLLQTSDGHMVHLIILILRLLQTASKDDS